MYYILYYLKNVSGCQLKDGFETRKKALEWLKERWDSVEWYSIESNL